MPSRASLFTGRHVPSHGVLDNGIPLDHRVPTFPGELAKRGYTTYSAGKLHLSCGQTDENSGHAESIRTWEAGKLDGWTGPYYGFEKVDLTLGHAEDPVEPFRGHYGQWLKENHPEVFEKTGWKNSPEPHWPDCWRSQIPAEAHHTTYVADRVIEYLENSPKDKPFFVFGGFPDPHASFAALEEYAKRWDGVKLPKPKVNPDGLKGKPSVYENATKDKVFRLDGTLSPAPESEHFHHCLQNTYAMVEMLDEHIGRILDAVDRLGLKDDTIICFTSDHGDMLGDHGLLFKGQVPFMSLMRVPFIVRMPGTKAAVTSAPMSNVDVMPTLMDLAGVDIPKGVQGVSHASVIRGEKERMQEAAFSSGWFKLSSKYRHMSLHSDTWRITWWPETSEGELYDLTTDPDEFHNIFDDPAHRQTRDRLLTELLMKYAKAGPQQPIADSYW